MRSKQLDSILKKLPSATAQPTSKEAPTEKEEETERIVAVIPKSLKKQIKQRIEENKGETEKTIILKGLKAIGFDIRNEWLVDKRSTR